MAKQPGTIRIGQVDLPVTHVIAMAVITPVVWVVTALLCAIF